ncbi:hypothetical protein PMAYCL1PPCAC_10526, partial [Pristionchus mayeri]
ADLVHTIAVNLLAVGVPINHVSAICENYALHIVHFARDMLAYIQNTVHSSHKAFIPELEDIIAVGERTLVLCRPPVAA